MNKRKQYVVKGPYQYKLVLKLFALLAIEAIAIVAFFFLIANSTTTTGYHGYDIQMAQTPYYFFLRFLMAVLAVGIFSGAMGMFVFILHSHRVYGPLYRFKKDLAVIEAGDFTKKIVFRDKDELHDLAEAMNRTISAANCKLAMIKKETDQILIALDKADMTACREAAKRLKSTSDTFKTTS